MGGKHWSPIIYPAPCQAWNTKRDNFPTPSTQQMTDVIDVNTVEMVSTSCIQFSVSGNLLSFPPLNLGQSHNRGQDGACGVRPGSSQLAADLWQELSHAMGSGQCLHLPQAIRLTHPEPSTSLESHWEADPSQALGGKFQTRPLIP